MCPPSNADCIFCKIVKGELPCTRIYESDMFLAFMDLNPISPGHSLIIPKGHYATLLDIPAQVGREMIPLLSRLGKALMSATKAEGFNCLQNNFAAAGQVVFHAHWHIIPRVEGDGLKQWPHKPSSDLAQREAMAEKIRASLGSASGANQA